MQVVPRVQTRGLLCISTMSQWLRDVTGPLGVEMVIFGYFFQTTSTRASRGELPEDDVL